MTDNTERVESGVAFPEHEDTEISVQATFLESGNQLQHLFIGLEPVILVQPEFDAEANEVTFIVTAVDLDPKGFLEILNLLKDSAEEMVRRDAERQAEQAAADEALRQANDEFEAAQDS